MVLTEGFENSHSEPPWGVVRWLHRPVSKTGKRRFDSVHLSELQRVRKRLDHVRTVVPDVAHLETDRMMGEGPVRSGAE